MEKSKKKQRLRDIVVPEGTSIRSFLRKSNRLVKNTNFYNIRKTYYSIKEEGFSYTLSRIKNVADPGHTISFQYDEYHMWIKNNEPSKEDLASQRKHVFKNNPKISIVIPMYKTPIKFFNPLIDSIINQTYSNWELCLADGSPERNFEIEYLCKKDSRIKYKFLDSNKGISGNTNEALRMATGDFIALMDHDDTLPPFSLFEIVKCINDNPNVEFIYTDEDNIDEKSGRRLTPHFKPDFAPDTLRAQNYICHFSIYRKDLMSKLGGLRSEYDGSQDHDLVLRVSELTTNIVHISKVLYHWRIVKSSFSNSNKTIHLSDIAGQAAIKAHLDRLGIPATVSEGKFLHSYEVKYKIIGNPKISIIIPNKDEYTSLKDCIDSILNVSTYKNIEILIIENNSTSEEIFQYYEDLKQFSNIKVLYYKEKEFNYSKIINFGVKNSSGEYIIQLNNDITVITPEWIEKMLGFAQRSDVGIVGAKLYFPDMTVQHCGVIIGGIITAFHISRNSPKEDLGYFGKINCIQNFSAVTGACLMCRKEIYEQVGYMDEDLKVNYNDIDFCLKVRSQNKLIVYTPFAELIHYESKTRQNSHNTNREKRLEYEKDIFKYKWAEILKQGDPYFNKNLRLDSPFYYINPNKISVNVSKSKIPIIILDHNDYFVTKKFINLIYNYSVIDKIIIVTSNSENHNFERLNSLGNSKVSIIKIPKGKGAGYAYNVALNQLDKKYKYVVFADSNIFIEEKMISACFKEIKKDKKSAIIAPRVHKKNLKPYKRSSWKEQTFIRNLINDSLFLKFISFPLYKKSLYSFKDFRNKKLNVDCISRHCFIAKVDALKEVNYFDENMNYFYLEDIICKKLKNHKYNIYSLNSSSYIYLKNDYINTFERKKILNKDKIYYQKTFNNINGIPLFILKLINSITYIETFIEFVINLFKRRKQ